MPNWYAAKELNLLKDMKKAGDGSRTHVASLEGWSFTTKLHPRLDFGVYYLSFIVIIR